MSKTKLLLAIGSLAVLIGSLIAAPAEAALIYDVNF